jgi:glycosyltransferase involved in cell wall biosynthesis
MACGLPVIRTTAAGEIRQRVDDGNGVLVPPSDPNALAEAMTRLARDPRLREVMGEASGTRLAGLTPTRWAREFTRAVTLIAESKDETAHGVDNGP